MNQVLDSNKILIATIALMGAGFIADIKKRVDASMFEINKQNRSETPPEIIRVINSL